MDDHNPPVAASTINDTESIITATTSNNKGISPFYYDSSQTTIVKHKQSPTSSSIPPPLFPTMLVPNDGIIEHQSSNDEFHAGLHSIIPSTSSPSFSAKGSLLRRKAAVPTASGCAEYRLVAAQPMDEQQQSKGKGNGENLSTTGGGGSSSDTDSGFFGDTGSEQSSTASFSSSQQQNSPKQQQHSTTAAAQNSSFDTNNSRSGGKSTLSFQPAPSHTNNTTPLLSSTNDAAVSKRKPPPPTPPKPSKKPSDLSLRVFEIQNRRSLSPPNHQQQRTTSSELISSSAAPAHRQWSTPEATNQRIVSPLMHQDEDVCWNMAKATPTTPDLEEQHRVVQGEHKDITANNGSVNSSNSRSQKTLRVRFADEVDAVEWTGFEGQQNGFHSNHLHQSSQTLPPPRHSIQHSQNPKFSPNSPNSTSSVNLLTNSAVDNIPERWNAINPSSPSFSTTLTRSAPAEEGISRNSRPEVDVTNENHRPCFYYVTGVGGNTELPSLSNDDSMMIIKDHSSGLPIVSSPPPPLPSYDAALDRLKTMRLLDTTATELQNSKNVSFPGHRDNENPGRIRHLPPPTTSNTDSKFIVSSHPTNRNRSASLTRFGRKSPRRQQLSPNENQSSVSKYAYDASIRQAQTSFPSSANMNPNNINDNNMYPFGGVHSGLLYPFGVRRSIGPSYNNNNKDYLHSVKSSDNLAGAKQKHDFPINTSKNLVPDRYEPRNERDPRVESQGSQGKQSVIGSKGFLRRTTDTAGRNLPHSKSFTPTSTNKHLYSDEEMMSRKIRVRLLGLDSRGVQIMELEKIDPGPFGFYIASGVHRRHKGIYISRVSARSLIPLLTIGDEILEINGVGMRGKSLEEAQSQIANREVITLTILPSKHLT